MPATTDVQAIRELDLERYAGLWYEIGRLPLKWEDAEATDITAQYTPQPDGTVQVDNRCFDKDGKPTRALGTAVRTDPDAAKLEVSFLPEFLSWIPFTKGDYWVLKLDPDYQVALVGTPDHENLWLLSRTPVLSQETEDEYLAAARGQGFDLSGWIRPAQNGRRVSDEQVAEG